MIRKEFHRPLTMEKGLLLSRERTKISNCLVQILGPFRFTRSRTGPRLTSFPQKSGPRWTAGQTSLEDDLQ